MSELRSVVGHVSSSLRRWGNVVNAFHYLIKHVPSQNGAMSLILPAAPRHLRRKTVSCNGGSQRTAWVNWAGACEAGSAACDTQYVTDASSRLEQRNRFCAWASRSGAVEGGVSRWRCDSVRLGIMVPAHPRRGWPGVSPSDS